MPGCVWALAFCFHPSRFSRLLKRQSKGTHTSEDSRTQFHSLAKQCNCLLLFEFYSELRNWWQNLEQGRFIHSLITRSDKPVCNCQSCHKLSSWTVFLLIRIQKAFLFHITVAFLSTERQPVFVTIHWFEKDACMLLSHGTGGTIQNLSRQIQSKNDRDHPNFLNCCNAGVHTQWLSKYCWFVKRNPV